MRILDKIGNVVTDPDLTKGYLQEEVIIKPDADPVDNKTKFAYEDNDYEQIKRYILYTKEDYINEKKQRVEELHQNLSDTDYIASKSMDKLLLCTTPEEMAEVTNYYRDKYSDTIEQRQEWRDEINQLNKEIRKEEKNA